MGLHANKNSPSLYDPCFPLSLRFSLSRALSSLSVRFPLALTERALWLFSFATRLFLSAPPPFTYPTLILMSEFFYGIQQQLMSRKTGIGKGKIIIVFRWFGNSTENALESMIFLLYLYLLLCSNKFWDHNWKCTLKRCLKLNSISVFFEEVICLCWQIFVKLN